MPHKRNPISAETISGLARVVRSNLLAGLQDVALWHERDISHSSVERVILPDSAQLTFYVLRRLRRLLDGLVVMPDRMLANLEASHGLVFSQPVLLGLVQSGLSRDDAYRIVQRNAMKSWDEGDRFPFVARGRRRRRQQHARRRIRPATVTRSSRSPDGEPRRTSTDCRSGRTSRRSVGSADAGGLQHARRHADVAPRRVRDGLALAVALRDADEISFQALPCRSNSTWRLVRLRGSCAPG